MADFAALAALQDLDSAHDQIGHRLQRLPERAVLAAIDAELASLRATRTAAALRGETATAEVETLETAGHARDSKKARLNQQLKTVIAPREAEALMHEIALLDEGRSAADDRELELLDIIEAADAEVASTNAAIEETSVRRDAAAAELAAVTEALAAERRDVDQQRAAAATGLGEGLLARYERMRTAHRGTGIARLAHGRCSGCHLDMSHTFLDQMRTHSGDDPMECEQCGRWLVP